MAFTKGTSGNPAGRPAGQTPGAQVRKAIEDRSTEILRSVIDAAVGGDMTACKMLLDRITPTLKPIAPQITINLPEEATLSEQGAAVIQAAFTGTVSPDLSANLLSALSSQARIIEVDELIRRIEVLENKQ
jgi:uncharacterized protein DUF5681